TPGTTPAVGGSGRRGSAGVGGLTRAGATPRRGRPERTCARRSASVTTRARFDRSHRELVARKLVAGAAGAGNLHEQGRGLLRWVDPQSTHLRRLTHRGVEIGHLGESHV